MITGEIKTVLTAFGTPFGRDFEVLQGEINEAIKEFREKYF